jgi:hypothetical protein
LVAVQTEDGFRPGDPDYPVTILSQLLNVPPDIDMKLSDIAGRRNP